MLVWIHTELGRRSACESYHIIRTGVETCELVDANWNLIAQFDSITAAQRLAEQREAKKQKRRAIEGEHSTRRRA